MPTIEIDRRYGAVGRVRVRSGTTRQRTYDRILDMLSELYEEGRLDILRGIRDGKLQPLDVLDAWRTKDLGRLPTAESVMNLTGSWLRWCEDYDCSESHKVSIRQSLRYITRHGKDDDLTAGDLPGRVSDLRVALKSHPRTFNLLRSHAQAYARRVLGKQHRIWYEISAIDPLAVKPSHARNPQAPAQLKALTDRMPLGYGVMAWTMALTGMGPREMWVNGWDVLADRVHIKGTKRESRDREVPLVGELASPFVGYPAFRRALLKASDGRVRVYDLRRSYANWLEAAGVPRTRRRMYLGHSAGDVTELYERHEVDAFLAEDAERIREYVERSIGASA